MILYFSGSGNSKYCAQKLGEILGDEVVNTADYIRRGEKGVFHSDRPWVICAPIYMAYIPLSLEKFIRESTFSGDDRMYFVATLGGSEKGGSIAPKMLEPLCGEIGKTYMGAGHISMPRNYVMLFSLPTESDIRQQLDEVDKILPQYADIIQNNRMMPDYKINMFEYVMVKPFLNLYYKLLTGDKKFFVDESCNGCGLCERECPHGNIKIADKKPLWNGNCTHCTSCINRCPRTAIQYGKGTINKGRYYLEKYKK